MAKELPYFRFTAQEWQNGDVSLENYSLKGLFIDVCAYYWVQDCVVTRKMLLKKFRNARKNLKELFELGILKHNTTTGEVAILFLNNQYDLLSELRKNKQDSGSLGGKKRASNARAALKQDPSYKDKDKENKKDKDKKTPPKKSDVVDKPNFIDQVISLWCSKYLEIRGDEYLITTPGKEKKAAGKITQMNKKKFPDAGSKEALKRIGVMFEICLKIKDTWLHNNMSMTIIYSKYNEIKTILDEKNKPNSPGNGATDEEIAAIWAKSLSEDR